MPAVQQVVQEVQQQAAVPHITVDEFGAVSMMAPGESLEKPTAFENVDGRRINDGRYDAFARDITGARAAAGAGSARGEAGGGPGHQARVPRGLAPGAERVAQGCPRAGRPYRDSLLPTCCFAPAANVLVVWASCPVQLSNGAVPMLSTAERLQRGSQQSPLLHPTRPCPCPTNAALP